MDAMQSLKGGTFHVLRVEFPDLEEYLWGDSFWSDGYIAEAVGQTEEAVLRAYIQNHGLPRRTMACPAEPWLAPASSHSPYPVEIEAKATEAIRPATRPGTFRI